MGGSNVEGISLTVRGGVPVSGRVRVEGETTASLARRAGMLQPAEAGGIVFGPFPTQQVKEDGSFQLEDVGADRYTVAVNSLPEGFYRQERCAPPTWMCWRTGWRSPPDLPRRWRWW